MKKYFTNGCLFFILASLLSLRCDESLPEYHFPQHVLSLAVTLIESLPVRPAPGHQKVHIRLACQNIYTDVFQDSIDIKGSMRIWWLRNPDLYRTYTFTAKDVVEQQLINNGKMTLLPGQSFTIDVIWDLVDYQGINLVTKMNFARLYLRVCSPDVACSDPEQFVVESSLNVFDPLGVCVADPKEFTFIGLTCISCYYPPCYDPGCPK